MPTVSLPGLFTLQMFTDAGALAAGYRLYTFAPSTTTKKVAYTESTGTTSHTYTTGGDGIDYIALNARGELPAPLFLQAGGYDIVLKDAAGNTEWTRRAFGVNDDSASTLDAALRAELLDKTTSGDGDAMIGHSAIYDIRDGTLTRHASLGAAITAIGSTRCTVVVRDDLTMSASATFPSTALLRGEDNARVTTTSYTLTCNGGFESEGSRQAFAGTGTVVFGTSDVEVRPEWWGTDATALQAAFTAAAGKRIRVSGSYSLASTTITVGAATSVNAQGASLTWSGNVTGLSFGSGVVWEGGTLTGAGNGAYNDAGRAIACAGTNNSPSAPTYVTGPKVRGVTITEWAGYGVRLQYCNGGEITGCNITEIGYAGIAILSCNDVAADTNIVDGVTPGTSGDAYGIFFDRLETGTETAEPRTQRTRIAYNVVKNVASGSGNNGQGIDTHGSIDGTIIGNTVSGCEVGIFVTASSVSGTQQLAPKRIAVVGNTIVDTLRLGYGIQVTGALNGSTVNEYAEGCVVSGNTISGHGIAGDGTSGAIRVQASKNTTITGNSVWRPSVYGIVLNLENVGINVTGNTIVDPFDNSVTIPGCIGIVGNNNSGLIAHNTLRFDSSGLGTYVAIHSIRINGSLTGLALQIGKHAFPGVASGRLDYSEGTSTGVVTTGMASETGLSTLASGTVNVTFKARMPTTGYRVTLSSGANETMRWSSKSATGFTITSSNASSTTDVDWMVTT